MTPAMLALLALAALVAASAWRGGQARCQASCSRFYIAALWIANRSRVFPTQTIALASALSSSAPRDLYQRAGGSAQISLFAFAAGVAVNYFDFLYVAGLSACGMAMLAMGADWAPRNGRFRACFLGYGAMFSAKWGLYGLAGTGRRRPHGSQVCRELAGSRRQHA